MGQSGGEGTIQLATPGSMDKSATATRSASGYEPKLIPGKRAICQTCGTTSPDFNKCVRCKRPIPPSCKVVDHSVVTEALKKQIIKQITEYHVSPKQLAYRHDISLDRIRQTVKDAGHELPRHEPKLIPKKARCKKPIPPNYRVLVDCTPHTTEALKKQVLVPGRGGLGTIQMATPGSKDKSATATGSASGYEPKLIPGKRAICKACGTKSPDFNKCVRCKRPIPLNCKVVVVVVNLSEALKQGT